MRMNFSSYPQQDANLVQVSYADSAGYRATGDIEHRNSPIFAPGGLCWKPKEGQQLLMNDCQGGSVCIGSLMEENSLQPGEIRMECGGGYIHLKQNGEIILNGVVISVDGRITPGAV